MPADGRWDLIRRLKCLSKLIEVWKVSFDMNIRNKNRKNARNVQKGTACYFKLREISTNSKKVENVEVFFFFRCTFLSFPFQFSFVDLEDKQIFLFS
jgi:hypothetical protein